jgi:DnaK suppressor protein
MTSAEKTQLKAKIENQIEELEKQIEALKEKTKPISPDCGLGRLTRLEAMGESHVNHKILDESKLRLTRLKNALSRIKHPMFGVCIECEEEIGIGRMEIRPESVRCVACADTKS